ncbi:MAG: hypothetical protein U9Q27_03545 [Patescibacteria group bacterium]|nr:hypothetical protein [Patescibacteria group bacterium]
MSEKKLFTIGCDPEFFLRQRKSGKMICAIPFIKGTKYEPENLPSGAGNVQRDNVAVEFATNPAIGPKDFVKKIQSTLIDVKNKIPKDCELVAEPSAYFSQDQLEHPEAKIFGCSPDFDAWAIAENKTPYLEDSTFRSCGAHIHVGHQKGDKNEFLLNFDGKIQMVRTMDAIHGVIATVLDNSKSAIDRRQLYGKAGAHRPKEYGVEYRVLSNFWLKSPELVMLIYNLTKDTVKLVRNDKNKELINKIGKNQIQNIINNGIVKDAKIAIKLHIMPLLSKESITFLEMCLEKVNDYNFIKEWNENIEGIVSLCTSQ